MRIRTIATRFDCISQEIEKDFTQHSIGRLHFGQVVVDRLGQFDPLLLGPCLKNME